jgi:hypothetical protein
VQGQSGASQLAAVEPFDRDIDLALPDGVSGPIMQY